ncbi:ketoacyl-ACP synthase II [Anopheles sinensis]|uniref:Ketoacyl-ACP synthase II n=1 Tax=Anopheles sinensis TaxID=74873 RepID=A0A084WGL6_ANOSI|nr:ketoacyl-ACP synthase II [Anopheles sinensis]
MAHTQWMASQGSHEPSEAFDPLAVPRMWMDYNVQAELLGLSFELDLYHSTPLHSPHPSGTVVLPSEKPNAQDVPESRRFITFAFEALA